MSDAHLIDEFADPASRIADTAVATLCACNVGADEQLLVLVDSATAPELTRAFTGAATASGHSGDVVLLSVSPRRPAFADLPLLAVDALLAADLVIDLTTVPWLYSDSFTRYGQGCRARGSRLALIWGMPESLRTLAACPPSATLADRARRALPRLTDARTVRVRSTTGTDFQVELGDPLDYQRSFIGEPPTSPGMIGAPLCASVTAPFVPWTAHGTLAFIGAGRFQGPENSPIRSELPVIITVESGRVVDVQGDHVAGIALADWFARAHHDDVFVVMDCNFGFDPRAELAWADNTVVHSFAGGIMIGFGNPYQYRPEGSHRPGYHLDLMFPGVDVDLDETPFIRAGAFVPDAGIG
jgi:hypothetical protein